MSIRDKEKEINSKSITSSFIAPSKPSKEVKNNISKSVSTTTSKKVSNATKSNTKKGVSVDKNGNVRTDKNGNVIYCKKENYTITFKIDADIDDYLKNIEKITFIENAKKLKIESTTKTEFVNKLIREQYYKLLGVSDKDDAETINQKWLDYKKKNNL